MNFSSLASYLLSRNHQLLPDWLPGGKMQGREYVCGDLGGGPGQSLKINTSTGKWADFATDERGGDLISLYAAIHSLTQKDAATKLSDMYSYSESSTHTTTKPVQAKLIPVPKGASLPVQLRSASGYWQYKNRESALLFIVARFDKGNGKKELRPWAWSSEGRWVSKAWPSPRPLYNLPKLHNNPDKPVLIVEGEKAADAAERLCGRVYTVITWPNGAEAWPKTDWKPVYGKRVLLWPDADSAGINAMNNIASHLHEKCVEVKVINVTNQARIHWDAADALQEGWDWDQFAIWAKPITSVYNPPKVPEIMPDEPSKTQSGKTEYHLHTTEEEPPAVSPEIYEKWQKFGLTMNQTKTSPIMNLANGIKILKRDKRFRNFLWFDEFHIDFFTTWDTDTPRSWDDADTLELMEILQNDYGLGRLQLHTVEQIVKSVAFKNTRNEPKEWFESLSWDGESRIETFAQKYMGSPDSNYTRAVSANWFKSMAARILRPGSQVDNMVILEGKQGARKTSLLRVLGGEWYTEPSADVGSKDFMQQIQGNLIIELAELDIFRKADVNTLKRVVSNTEDNFRVPYGKKNKKFPRRCVFVGTTNQDDYLMDETGNRRYWPLPVTDINLEGISEIREQLFAEAVHRVKNKETWWEVPEDEAMREQEKRVFTHPWRDKIIEYIDSNPYLSQRGVTIMKLLTDSNCLNIDIGRVKKQDANAVGRILRELRWAYRDTTIKEDGERKKARVFYPPSSPYRDYQSDLQVDEQVLVSEEPDADRLDVTLSQKKSLTHLPNHAPRVN